MNSSPEQIKTEIEQIEQELLGLNRNGADGWSPKYKYQEGQ